MTFKKLTKKRLDILRDSGRAATFQDMDGYIELFQYCKPRERWLSKYDIMTDEDILEKYGWYYECTGNHNTIDA